MVVRVIDLRPAAQSIVPGSGVQAAVPSYVAALIGTTTATIVRFPYNPESWRKTNSPEWADRGLPAREAQVLDWKRNGPSDLSIDYVLQLDDSQQTSAFIGQVETLSTIPNEVTGEPEIWLFEAGVFNFRGHVSSLSINYLRTDPQGDPDIAEIQITLTANDKGFGL